jgi:hypothetical protein
VSWIEEEGVADDGEGGANVVRHVFVLGHMKTQTVSRRDASVQ